MAGTGHGRCISLLQNSEPGGLRNGGSAGCSLQFAENVGHVAMDGMAA
jgi:hypothetical protein